MSVALATQLESVDAVLVGHPAFKVVSFTAGRVRELDLGVCRDPLPAFEAHALVFASRPQSGDIPQKTRRLLAADADWVTDFTLEELAEAKARTTPPEL
ncbi:MAG: hypothetical protein WD227_04215 [Vicinamibacterales bacterium]